MATLWVIVVVSPKSVVGGGSGMSSENFVNTVLKPICVALVIALILGCVALYNEVQANTAYRISAEKRLDLLVGLNQQVLIIGQDIKYLRKDVDVLKTEYVVMNKELQEARIRELQPWKYQSSPE